MTDTQIRVRLAPEIRARLDEFCLRTSRNLTNAVNVLLDLALAANPGPSREIAFEPEVLASIAAALHGSKSGGDNNA